MTVHQSSPSRCLSSKSILFRDRCLGKLPAHCRQQALCDRNAETALLFFRAPQMCAFLFLRECAARNTFLDQFFPKQSADSSIPPLIQNYFTCPTWYSVPFAVADGQYSRSVNLEVSGR